MAHTYGTLERHLEEFLEDHLDGLENEERVEALSWYCQGLGIPTPEKTIRSMALAQSPDAMEGRRQRMQRALTQGRFSHEQVFERLQTTVFTGTAGSIDAYALDDTGIAKKGSKSPGVHRQYSGTLGKVDNCQVFVSLHAVSDEFSACLGIELFLPEAWASDEERLNAAKVPEDRRSHRTKPAIALELLEKAVRNGAPRRPVVADAGYGDSRDFRDAVRALGLDYVVAVSANTTIWPPGARPEVPASTGKVGRPFSYEYDPKGKEPERVDVIAKRYWRSGKFRSVSWRQGSNKRLDGKYLALRVKSAERRTKGRHAGEDIWLLIERDETRGSGFKYYLSSFPESISLKRLVRLAKVRWRIERDYRDLKQKLGFDRYEGRTWGGLHRHLAMAALLHAFLSIHREAFSPGPVESMDMVRVSESPCACSHQMERTLPHVSKEI